MVHYLPLQQWIPCTCMIAIIYASASWNPPYPAPAPSPSSIPHRREYRQTSTLLLTTMVLAPHLLKVPRQSPIWQSMHENTHMQATQYPAASTITLKQLSFA